MGADVKQMLQSIHTNFVCLTQRVPITQVEDFPEAMQRQVVSVPRAWVRLFQWLARAILCYHDQNPPPPQDQRPESIPFCMTLCYILVARKTQFCIMTLMYYDVTFWILMKNFYDDRFYLFTCVQKCMFVICLWSMKQMPI